jgi:hypothetical protein
MHPIGAALRIALFKPLEETAMKLLCHPARVWAAAATLVLSLLAVATPTQAAFVAYTGSGNAVLFDATTGDGGWVGTINEVPDPTIAEPLSLVSVVLFNYDAVTRMLSGSFEFTTAADLSSSLVGTLSGSTLDADLFGSGGQFEIDYLITGGSGAFAGASGFGLAFLNFSPSGVPDNYSESGLLVFDVPGVVPVPASLGLAALGLMLALVLPAAPRSQRGRR